MFVLWTDNYISKVGTMLLKMWNVHVYSIFTTKTENVAWFMEQGIVHAWKLNITTIYFSSDHVQISYFFYGLKFLGITSF